MAPGRPPDIRADAEQKPAPAREDRPDRGPAASTVSAHDLVIPSVVCQIRRAMDLTFDADQEGFRAEARAWLAAHVPTEPLPPLGTPAGLDAHRAWEAALFAARWSVVHWPVEFGGRDAGIVRWLIFEEEYARARAPRRVSRAGISLAGAALLEHGPGRAEGALPATDGLRRGDLVRGPGREPGAHGDLADVRWRAVRNAGGDGWVLNGRRAPVAQGAVAQWCFCILHRQGDPESRGGLSCFLVALDSPGVTVRPIATMDGEAGARRDPLRGRRGSRLPAAGGPWRRREHRRDHPGRRARPGPAERGAPHRGGRSTHRPLPTTGQPCLGGRCRRPGAGGRPGDRGARPVDRQQGGRRAARRAGGELQRDLLVRGRCDHPPDRAGPPGPRGRAPRFGLSEPVAQRVSRRLADQIETGTHQLHHDVVADRLLGLPEG